MNILLAILGSIVFILAALKGSKKVKTSIIFDSLPAGITRWKKQILEASNITGVPAEIIAAVMWQESFPPGNPDSIGDNGNSFGLMQVQKDAATDVKNIYGFDSSNWKQDPLINIITGAYYLKIQRKNHANWNEALEAYNQGKRGRLDIPSTAVNEKELAIEYRNKINAKINRIT